LIVKNFLISLFINTTHHKMEHYGDVHLHETDYPGCKQPGVCGAEQNYYHGNQCGGQGEKNGHPYDCHCNLCQAPYSLPYQSAPGGHLGDMGQVKPCGNPNCRCTDCDGNCKCGANSVGSPGAGPEPEGNIISHLMGMINIKYVALLLVLAFLVYMYLKRRR
jgi:hypothetical protein